MLHKLHHVLPTPTINLAILSFSSTAFSQAEDLDLEKLILYCYLMSDLSYVLSLLPSASYGLFV